MNEFNATPDDVIEKAIQKATSQPTPEKQEKNKPVNHSIIFYCKNCKETVQAEKENKSLSFICPLCKKKNIAIGTQKSIENFYHSKK